MNLPTKPWRMIFFPLRMGRDTCLSFLEFQCFQMIYNDLFAATNFNLHLANMTTKQLRFQTRIPSGLQFGICICVKRLISLCLTSTSSLKITRSLKGRRTSSLRHQYQCSNVFCRENAANLNDMKEMLANLPQYQDQREKVVSPYLNCCSLRVCIVFSAPEYGPKLYGNL